MSKLNPLNDLVVVKCVEKQTRTISGIVIPNSAGDEPHEAEVVATGPVSGAISVGDKIIFAKHAGQMVKIDGVELLILKQEEVLAVIEA
jgi:chaperonin GroES